VAVLLVVPPYILTHAGTPAVGSLAGCRTVGAQRTLLVAGHEVFSITKDRSPVHSVHITELRVLIETDRSSKDRRQTPQTNLLQEVTAILTALRMSSQCAFIRIEGKRGSVMLKTLCYKPKGRGFEAR
jgi:hypothetical protein